MRPGWELLESPLQQLFTSLQFFWQSLCSPKPHCSSASSFWVFSAAKSSERHSTPDRRKAAFISALSLLVFSSLHILCLTCNWMRKPLSSVDRDNKMVWEEKSDLWGFRDAGNKWLLIKGKVMFPVWKNKSTNSKVIRRLYVIYSRSRRSFLQNSHYKSLWASWEQQSKTSAVNY